MKVYTFGLVSVAPETIARGPLGEYPVPGAADQTSMIERHWAMLNAKVQDEDRSHGITPNEYACILVAVPGKVADTVVEAIRAALHAEME